MLLALAFSFQVSAQVTKDDGDNGQDANDDVGYRYLLKEATTSINNKGLKTTRLHNRIEIQKQHAVDVIGDVSIPYNAFRSEARVVKAFTQTADGRVVDLKKDSVRELTPDDVASYQMYTDVHQITFSMPALGKGAIMDYEVEIVEKKPVIPGDFWVSEFLDSSAQVCTSRVAVTFPVKQEVKIVATNLSAGATLVDVTNGRWRSLTWEMRDIPALEYEAGMPPYDVVRAQVHLSSVKSWQQVEDWYRRLAKGQLREDPEIASQARKLTSGLTNRMDQIQALYQYASHDVRYVGVELGRSAYEPHSPRQTMQNKYGDCKDKAALLVSLLRAAGIQAYMALVRPNYDGPVDQNLPGPSQFSHAIVYVPGDQGDLWIDATQPFCEVTEHGYHLDGTDALVVGLAGKTFVHVPVSDETHSVHRLTYDLNVHYGGLCTVHEIQEYTGRAAIAERERRSRIDADKVRRQLERNFSSGVGYSRLLDYSFTNPTNDCDPMRVVCSYDSDSFLTTTKTGHTVRFDAASLRDWLDLPRADPTSTRKHKRLYPWVARTAHTEEIVCLLHLPPGYELARTPTTTRKELPHGQAEMLFDDSMKVPRLTLRITRRPARIEAADIPEVAQEVEHALARVRASLDLEDGIDELMREHRYTKAEAAVVEAARQHTNSVDALLRLGIYYKSVGRVFRSQQAFEKVIELSPNDPRGYEKLADTYSGPWGFPGEGFDRHAIMGVYDRALTNVPVPAWVINKKAEVCLIDDCGRPDATNRLDEAEGYYRQLLKDDPENYGGLFGLGRVNRLRGNYDKAEDYFRKAARAKSDEVGPRAGIWFSMAFAGRDEEACNAIASYYGTGPQMNAEVARVATLLTLSRHYAAAANLYNRIVESAARPEVIEKLVRLVRKMEKVKRDDYASFYDDSTPEGLAQTLLVACSMNDTNKLLRCLAPSVNREEATYSMQKSKNALGGIAANFDVNYLLDAARAGYEISKRPLGNGDVEVELDSSKAATTASSPFGNLFHFQVQRTGDRWQAITIGDLAVDYETLARLSLDALNRGDKTNAIAYQTRIADLAGVSAWRRNAPSFADHLKEIAFTDDALRVKAWAGMALITANNRSDVLLGVACLDELSSAYPEDAWIKITVAYAHKQTANVKQAAAILKTINIAKLAAPGQLAQLAWVLLELEQLDDAERAIARLREVEPDDEQLLALQAYALICRAKYQEAGATVAKLRNRGKMGSRMALQTECLLIGASRDQAALHDLIDHWRESGNEKLLSSERTLIFHRCLAFGLNAEALEQVATMIAEEGMHSGALLSYADVAVASGDIAEARDLVSRTDHASASFDELRNSGNLGQMRFVLGDYTEAARLYREAGRHRISDYSGYTLCMSALAARLAGDTATAAETLKEAAAMQGDGDWPRLAIQYVSGDISEEQFRQTPERTTIAQFRRNSRECEVNCLIGLVKESNHDIPGALAAYNASIATQSVVDVEFFIAKCAVQRLQSAGKTN